MLSVDNRVVSEIEHGLCVFLGIKQGDSEEQAEKIAYKISGLRIFEDANGKMNLSVKDVKGGVRTVTARVSLWRSARRGLTSCICTVPKSFAVTE